MNAPAGQVVWLFDLGNTRLKGRWSRDRVAGNEVGIEWRSVEASQPLDDLLRAWPTPARVLVASVASIERQEHLRHALQGLPHGMVEWLVAPRQACGITNAYQRPERLGIDRFLAMVGAREASDGAPFTIVGCGTALTLDAVDAQGRQGDGLIVPSPDLMMRSLRAGTAIGDTNPDAFAGDSSADADDTQRAIRAGCWNAAAAVVESFHACRRSEFGGETPLWVHGGGAAALHKALEARGKVSARVLGDAIWRGLELWAAQLCDHP